MSAQHLSPPQPVQLSKRGSLTPSIVRLLTRYPPAIIEDTPIPETQQSQTEQVIPDPVTPFESRFPQGYKVADSSIPLHPDEVPAGYENLFSPSYYPICRRVSDLCTKLTVVLFMGINLSSVMGCWRRNIVAETDWIEFDYGPESLLDEGAVVEVEYESWCFMWTGFYCSTTYRYYRGHDSQELYHSLIG